MELIKKYEEFSRKESSFVIKTERVNNIPPKKFADGRHVNFYIRIYIAIESLPARENVYSMDDISFVQYILDPSYKDRIRISYAASNGFEIKVWSYGYYNIQAILYPKFGATISLSGFVKFPVSKLDYAAFV